MSFRRPVWVPVPLSLGIILTCIIGIAHAQAQSDTDASVSIGGILQSETDYAWIGRSQDNERVDRVGFGLRRARLLATAGIGSKTGAFVQLDGDGGGLSVLDAFISFYAGRRLRLRVGRMASAQPRAFILTPVIAMDATERAAIALLWHGGTLGSKGRDFGVDVRYSDERIDAILFLHNGDGSFERTRRNYQPNIAGDVLGGGARSLRRMALSTYFAFRPQSVVGLEVGAFAGYNGSRGPNTAVEGLGRTYLSYAAHLYWGAEPGSQPLRLKVDMIGVRYEESDAVTRQHTFGLSILGAFAIHRAAEIFGRLEAYNAGLEGDTSDDVFIATGVSVSPSRLRGRPFYQERITVAYNVRVPETNTEPASHLMVLQLQLKF